MSRPVRWMILTIAGLFLLACAGIALPIDFAVALTFGWAPAGGRSSQPASRTPPSPMRSDSSAL